MKLILVEDDGTQTDLLITQMSITVNSHRMNKYSFEAIQSAPVVPPTMQPFAPGNGIYKAPAGAFHYRVYGHGGGGGGSGQPVELKKCECGKEKHNFFKHTDWCPIKD